MITDTTQYTRIVFWLKLMLGLSASFLFLVIFQFSYSKKVDTPFSVVTKDVRIGLKYQARETHITGNTYDGGTFDFHAKALNPSHQNDKTVILSKPLGEISLSSEQKFNFSSDFASLNLDEKNIKKLLKAVKNLENTKEKFVSTLAFYDPQKNLELFSFGELEGQIIREKKGDNGFGYDPIFKIKNSCLTLAEVSFEERMKISHRAKSTQEMLKHLNQLYK